MGEICFDGYLRSLVNAYQKWQKQYTLTDVMGRSLQEKVVTSRDVVDEEPSFDYFDFGLMVQTVSSQKEKGKGQKEDGEEKGELEEKIERLPVLEGICKYAGQHDLGNHVLLVGRPGSGKSTALARLLLQEAEGALSDRQAKIPVLVELRYLPSEANEWAVCDRIRAFMLKHDPELQLDVAAVENLLRQGRLLLLVDGVNELPSERSRHQVNVFRQDYQKTCPMIFTTRELSAGGDLGIAKKLEMQPLSESQMQQFVMAYLPTQGEKLLRQLSGRLREFGQTPLLLWMLCSLFRQTEQIPPNLGMVFRAFTLGYGNQIKQDVPLYKDSRVWWGRLLQYLAFVMIVGDSATEARVAISRREAERVLVEFLRGKVEHPDDCAIRWLEDLLKHHLLLVSNDQIEFRHQLIQEYYAAEWLLGLLPSLSDARLQHDYLNYLKWTEPLALMLELVESEEQAVRVVRLALEVDLRLGARLAGAVKYTFQEKTVGLLIQEIEEQKIPQEYAIELLGGTRSDHAIEPLKKLNSNASTKTLIEALGNIGDEKAIDLLSNYLKNRYVHDDNRKRIVEILGNLGGKKSVDLLIDSLNDESSTIRKNTATALGNLASKKSVDPLLNSFNKSWCKNVANALVKIGIEKTGDTLIYKLKSEDFNASKGAAHILVRIGGDKAITIFINALANQNSNVRRIAVEALGEIGSNSVIETVIQTLSDQDPYVRRESARALGKIGGKQAIAPLIHALNDPNLSVISNAVEALGKIGCIEAVDSLIESLSIQSSDIRGNAAQALGEIGSDKSIIALTSTIHDQNPQVSRKAAKALGEIGSDKSISALISLTINQSSSIRANATEILGDIGNIQVIYPLIHTLGDQDSRVRQKAVYALGKIRCDKTTEVLIQTLKDENSDVRRIAVQALENVNSEKFIESLIQMIKCEDSYVRMKIAEILSKTKSDKVIAPLIDILKDQDSSVRREAVRTLGKIENDKVIDALIDALKDQDSLVRRLALQALGKIKSDKAVESLIQSLNDKDYNVIWDAVDALINIGNDKAIEPFIQVLQDNKIYECWNRRVAYELHNNVAYALVEIFSDKSIELLIQYINNKEFDFHSKDIVISALGKTDSEKAVNTLIHCLNDTNSNVRRCATIALGNLISEKATDALIRTLNDQSLYVRKAAAIALGNSGIKKAVDILILDLKYKDSYLDKGLDKDVAEALIKVDTKQAIEVFIDILNDQDVAVRRDAKEIIEKLTESDRNLPTLTQQLPHLLTLIPTESSQQALSVITAIQSRCKYYNYDIAQMTFPPEDKANPTTGKTYIFQAPVSQVVENLVVQRDNIATQNNPKTNP